MQAIPVNLNSALVSLIGNTNKDINPVFGDSLWSRQEGRTSIKVTFPILSDILSAMSAILKMPFSWARNIDHGESAGVAPSGGGGGKAI